MGLFTLGKSSLSSYRSSSVESVKLITFILEEVHRHFFPSVTGEGIGLRYDPNRKEEEATKWGGDDKPRKTKRCWMEMNHPDGSPYPSHLCFALLMKASNLWPSVDYIFKYTAACSVSPFIRNFSTCVSITAATNIRTSFFIGNLPFSVQ